jgi:hypothetical protein
MKHALSFYLIALLVMRSVLSVAQCSINTINTQVGFTPNVSALIVDDTPTVQSTQLFVMSSFTYQGQTANIDSVSITNITGFPPGINYVFNPVSQTFPGGGHAAMCFSGTTNGAGGSYPLSFTGVAHTNFGNVPFSDVPDFSSFFSFTLEVAGPAHLCRFWGSFYLCRRYYIFY